MGSKEMSESERSSIGPHPSFVQLATPYLSESHIQASLRDVGSDEARDISLRLQGVAWIDNVRRALQLQVVESYPHD